jgi:hypothetical protein
MDTTTSTSSKQHYNSRAAEAGLVPSQEAVDLALFEAAKEGDLHAAFIAIQKGADLSAQHDIVRHAPTPPCLPGGRVWLVDKFFFGILCAVRHALLRGLLADRSRGLCVVGMSSADDAAFLPPCAWYQQRKETALHAAAYGGHKDMVAFLVQVGANIDCQTVRPLDDAAVS